MITLVNQDFEDDVSFDEPVTLLGCRFRGVVRLVGDGSYVRDCMFDGEVFIDGVPWDEFFETNKVPGLP